MDAREPLLAELARYLERHPGERIAVDHVIQFVRANPDCFERTCVPGHVTGSAWILSPDRRAFLLAHHAKLDRWLQCGGHSDGDPDTAAVALREAREESGIERFEFAQRDAAGPRRRSTWTCTCSRRAARSPRTCTTTCATC